MRWQDRLFWPVGWTVYLGPFVFFAAGFALQLFLVSAYDCKMSARGIYPCVIAGHDFGAFVSGGAMAGYAIFFFVIPWLVIGGILVGLIAWLDRKN